MGGTIVLIVLILSQPSGVPERMDTLKGFWAMADCELSIDLARERMHHRGLPIERYPIMYCVDQFNGFKESIDK